MELQLTLILLLGVLGATMAQFGRRHRPDCSAIFCGIPNCPNPYTPPGECCPVCPKPAEKQGVCPRRRSPGFGTCVEECRSDFDCPGRQKCCSNGCGRTCQYPRGGSGPIVPNCAAVLCAEVFCLGAFTPPGECCPRCPPQGYARRRS